MKLLAVTSPVFFIGLNVQVDVGGGSCRRHGGGRRCGAEGCLKTDVGGGCGCYQPHAEFSSRRFVFVWHRFHSIIPSNLVMSIFASGGGCFYPTNGIDSRRFSRDRRLLRQPWGGEALSSRGVHEGGASGGSFLQIAWRRKALPD